MSIILDAGPTLNFIAVGQENCLIQFAAANRAKLAVPGRVDREIRGMAKNLRFQRTQVAKKWPMLSGTHIEVLDDELSTQLFVEAISRVSGMPANERVRERASLGEILAIAHASVIVQGGQDVTLLIDERDGTQRAILERSHLHGIGCAAKLRIGSTPRLLTVAASAGWLKHGLSRDEVYQRMVAFDDALPKQPNWPR